ncbi:Hypothetical protein CINCED_3A016724 [Cinara cedri]|uniref:Uncharacterized protein n=1 Tax=Cinara cedri TaxID=506608 RepID=A0A5E4M7C7_9HEMI|nr:Hypothetical protein CINCED_3A016724 [Cinara cedri]
MHQSVAPSNHSSIYRYACSQYGHRQVSILRLINHHLALLISPAVKAYCTVPTADQVHGCHRGSETTRLILHRCRELDIFRHPEMDEQAVKPTQMPPGGLPTCHLPMC